MGERIRCATSSGDRLGAGRWWGLRTSWAIGSIAVRGPRSVSPATLLLGVEPGCSRRNEGERAGSVLGWRDRRELQAPQEAHRSEATGSAHTIGILRSGRKNAAIRAGATCMWWCMTTTHHQAGSTNAWRMATSSRSSSAETASPASRMLTGTKSPWLTAAVHGSAATTRTAESAASWSAERPHRRPASQGATESGTDPGPIQPGSTGNCRPSTISSAASATPISPAASSPPRSSSRRAATSPGTASKATSFASPASTIAQIAATGRPPAPSTCVARASRSTAAIDRRWTTTRRPDLSWTKAPGVAQPQRVASSTVTRSSRWLATRSASARVIPIPAGPVPDQCRDRLGTLGEDTVGPREVGFQGPPPRPRCRPHSRWAARTWAGARPSV